MEKQSYTSPMPSAPLLVYSRRSQLTAAHLEGTECCIVAQDLSQIEGTLRRGSAGYLHRHYNRKDC